MQKVRFLFTHLLTLFVRIYVITGEWFVIYMTTNVFS